MTPSLSNLPLPPPARRRLAAALGWIGLDNPDEARAELDALPPDCAGQRDVLACRLALASSRDEWASSRDLAEALVMREPEEPQWIISLAYATRRCRSLPEAEAILRAARPRFPQDAILPYNLACYAAQQGRLDEARTLLAEAAALDESVMDLAATDPDLLPLKATAH